MIEPMSGTPYPRGSHRPHAERLGALLARAADALRAGDLTLVAAGPNRPPRRSRTEPAG